VHKPMFCPIRTLKLTTLFVRLFKPPRNVQIADLPVNVVPSPRTSTQITVLLEDDSLLSISRDQVVALLNFGMTDYTSQGKSRLYNAVDLTIAQTIGLIMSRYQGVPRPKEPLSCRVLMKRK
jgi:hypothetical protein